MSEQATVMPDPESDQQDSRRRAIIILALAILVIVLLLASLLRGLARVPDITGLPLGQAEQVLEYAGFSAGAVSEDILVSAPAGTVVEQAPAAGAWAVQRSAVDLVVASAELAQVDSVSDDEPELRPAPEPRDADEEDTATDRPPEVFGPFMPNVLGMSRAQAQSRLAESGYRYTVRSGPSTTSITPGLVFYQSIAPHEPAERGSLVVIWISTGPPGPADRSPRPEQPDGL